MSQDAPETVAKCAVDAWARNDLDAVMSLYHPDVEWDFSHYEGWPEDPVLRGQEAVRAFLEQWRTTFGDYEYGVDRYLDAADRVVALCWQGGRGRESTQPVLMQFAQVITIRGGRVVRVENYSDRAEALEAVGLRE